LGILASAGEIAGSRGEDYEVLSTQKVVSSHLSQPLWGIFWKREQLFGLPV
jgi:hypothetical protein